MSIASQTDFYLDFGRYGDLKRGARNRSDEAMQAVARQFEGLMLQQMLAAMRSSIAVDEANQSSYTDFYREMYDKQLAQVIAGRGGLGLAQMITSTAPGFREVQGELAAHLADNRPDNLTLPERSSIRAQLSVLQYQPDTEYTAINSGRDSQSASITDSDPGSDAAMARPYLNHDFAEVNAIKALERRWAEPLGFVSDIWPHARKAADQLGIQPGFLVAQAALETGWGQRMMKFADGRNGFNLFGIKAGRGWQGAVLARPSLEFRDGLMQSEVSRFRAYASPADSFTDYVNFIQGNSRYQSALLEASKGNGAAYIKGIHAAGYATDPDYAQKILGIANGQTLKQFLASANIDNTGVSDNA